MKRSDKLKGLVGKVLGISLGALILATSPVKSSECNINLYKKTSKAKTSYTLSGDSISTKVIEKLSKQCNFTIKLMSIEQKRKMDIARLRARLAKMGVK